MPSKRAYGLMAAIILLLSLVAAAAVIVQGTDGTDDGEAVNLDEVPEEAVRRLFDENGVMMNPNRRLARIAREREGGFGGFHFDGAPKGTAFVFMLDPDNRAAAEAAFHAAYVGGQREITRVVPVQGDFSFADLVEWYYALDTALVENDIHPTSGAPYEIDNRIRFGLADLSQAEDARQIMSELGIPEGAVIFAKEQLG